MALNKIKRVFNHKKLFLVLACIISILSCNKSYRDNGNVGDKNFPSWYLSEEEQKKNFSIGPTVLFASTKTPEQHYRIPAIIVAKNGNIVAICDNRHTKFGDIGQADISDFIDIVYKVSKDGGATWSEEKIIPPKTTANDFTKANNKGDALVFRHTDGTLVCMAVSGGGYAAASNEATPSRMLRSESIDNGETWSNWEEVGQDLFQKVKDNYGKKRGFATSGKGLTLKDGTFAAGLSVDGGNKGVVFVYAYSKDKGKSWNYAGSIEHSDTAVLINEPKPIAELEDGRILMSVRNARNPDNTENDNFRLYAIFNADGTKMPTQLSKWDFLDGSINAEGVVWTRASEQDKNRMLHIQGGPYGRKGLQLYLSEDEGLRWKSIQQILDNNTRAAYSSIDVLGDGTIVTLAEEQSKATGTTDLQYDIVFRRYNMFALTGEVYQTSWYK